MKKIEKYICKITSDSEIKKKILFKKRKSHERNNLGLKEIDIIFILFCFSFTYQFCLLKII